LRDSGKVAIQSLRRSTPRADTLATVPVALESYKGRLHTDNDTNIGSYTRDNTTKGYDRADDYNKTEDAYAAEPAPAEEACLLANTVTERLINGTGNNDTT
jgi:hypothetical protein